VVGIGNIIFFSGATPLFISVIQNGGCYARTILFKAAND
jgi:hypothetical protein